MAQIDSIIDAIKKENYKGKLQLVSYTYRILTSIGEKLEQEDKNTLLTFSLQELTQAGKDILNSKSEQEKDTVISYADGLTHIITVLCPDPLILSEQERELVRLSVALIEQETKLERAVEAVFGSDSDTIEEADITELFSYVPDGDVYKRCKLYDGVVHFQANIDKMSAKAKDVFSCELTKDLRLYLGKAPKGEELHLLELAADLTRHFATYEALCLLSDITELGHTSINCYALRTLLECSHELPDGIIMPLAKDLEYANLAYSFLEQANKEHMFPEEYSTPEYLAKSDLVHWLCYPTELGKAPDEIEYLGEVKKLFSKDIYYIFKFRSESDTLGDDVRGKWLVGWSNDDGGTFSEFELFSDFDRGDIKATLKSIKKHVVG